ncbi:MAG: hypothetical protein ACRD2X_04710, partial [Vicinamibacteraceae bacterium]
MTTFNVWAARRWSSGWLAAAISLMCTTPAAAADEAGDAKAAAAGQERPSAGARSLLRVTRSAVVTATTEAITVDGVLDEPVWQSSPDIGDLVQREPRAGT